jgi:hypothetical protein
MMSSSLVITTLTITAVGLLYLPVDPAQASGALALFGTALFVAGGKFRRRSHSASAAFTGAPVALTQLRPGGATHQTQEAI